VRFFFAVSRGFSARQASDSAILAGFLFNNINQLSKS